MVELHRTRAEMGCERNLTDETATGKHPRGSPTLSTLQKQEKRIALKELVNHEVGHVKANNEPRASLRLTPKGSLALLKTFIVIPQRRKLHKK